jgi:hypothetical protein
VFDFRLQWFLSQLSLSLRPQRNHQESIHKMPFTMGEDDLLQLNQDHDFDFSVQFEQLFFSIIPSILFIVTSFWRTLSQARKPIVVQAPVFQLTKVVRCRALTSLL